jgi:predicted Zn-ribbon and HTH transcriptional regulator
MTKQEKIIEKLLERPTSLKYSEIENLFNNEKFKIEQRK